MVKNLTSPEKIKDKLIVILGPHFCKELASQLDCSRSAVTLTVKGLRKNRFKLLHLANLIGYGVHGVYPETDSNA